MGTISGKRFVKALAPFAAVLFITAVAFAQTETGRITGTIIDSGHGVAKAQIEAHNIQNGLIRKTKANDSGTYSMPNLKPGVYDVTVHVDGKAARTERVRVTVGTPSRLDFNLDTEPVHGKK
jgi:carboxypeptidase family protein